MLLLFNNDKEALEDFLECRSPKEISIILMYQNNAPKLRAFIEEIQQDIDDSAKDLAM